MLNLFIFILATSGLSYGVTQSELFKALREYVSKKHIEKNIATEKRTSVLYWYLAEVLTCPFCFGFYSGIIMYLLIYVLPCKSITFPFIGSVVSMIIYLIIKKLK